MALAEAGSGARVVAAQTARRKLQARALLFLGVEQWRCAALSVFDGGSYA